MSVACGQSATALPGAEGLGRGSSPFSFARHHPDRLLLTGPAANRD
jgi:hypothetical protein